MVDIYVKRIKNGQMTVNDVPAIWRGRVEAKLK